MLIGLENGLIKVVSKSDFQTIAETKLIDAPILKIEQVMEAILVQYKDKVGSVVIAQLTKNNQLQHIFTVETMSSGFTLMAACALYDGITDIAHVCLATANPECPHMPKLWLLNQRCDSLLSSNLLDALPTAGGREEQKIEFGNVKKKTGKAPKVKEALPTEGSVSCLYINDHNVDPELFVGFESGAVGMFKMMIEGVDDKQRIQTVKLFSGQKLI